MIPLMDIPQIPKFKGDFRVGTLHYAEPPSKKDPKKFNHFILKVIEPEGAFGERLLAEVRSSRMSNDTYHMIREIFEVYLCRGEQTNPGIIDPINNLIEENLLKKTPSGDYRIISRAFTTQDQIALMYNVAKLLEYNPVSFDLRDPKQIYPHLFILGTMRFQVFQLLDGVRETKKVFDTMSISTQSKEFEYIHPLSITWYVDNLEWLEKNGLLLKSTEHETYGQDYLKKRQALMGY